MFVISMLILFVTNIRNKHTLTSTIKKVYKGIHEIVQVNDAKIRILLAVKHY